MTLREDYNRDGYIKYSGLKLPDMTSWNEMRFFEYFKISSEYYLCMIRGLAKNMVLQEIFMKHCINDTLGYLFTGITDVYSDLFIIEQPVLHVMSPALRIPGGYYGTEAHQDWPSTQGSLDCVTVWIPLTDAGIGNFPLEVIPGSHLGGLREGKMNGSVLEVEADDKDFVPIECRVGDVVFLSGFLVHRTGKGNGFRIAVSQRFDNALEPTFSERWYPCAQKRVIDRAINWKPTIEQVQAIYA